MTINPYTCLVALVCVGLACGEQQDGGATDAGPALAVDAGEGCDPSSESACRDELVCLVDRCVPAYEPPYQLTIFSGEIGEKDGAGNGWDGQNGAPDPGVLVFVDDQLIGSTQSHNNTYEPVFPKRLS